MRKTHILLPKYAIFRAFMHKMLWKTSARGILLIFLLLFLFYNFYKTIDFLQKIGYNGVTKRIKQTSKPQKGGFAREQK